MEDPWRGDMSGVFCFQTEHSRPQWKKRQIPPLRNIKKNRKSVKNRCKTRKMAKNPEQLRQ